MELKVMELKVIALKVIAPKLIALRVHRELVDRKKVLSEVVLNVASPKNSYTSIIGKSSKTHKADFVAHSPGTISLVVPYC